LWSVRLKVLAYLILLMLPCAQAQQTAQARAKNSEDSSQCNSATSVEGARGLWASFNEDRVYVLMRAKKSGRKLCFYTDTGGGLVISENAVKELGLSPSTDPEIAKEVGPDARVIKTSTFDEAITAPGISDASSIMVVVPELRQMPEMPAQGDGILGQAWFANRVWTWDYPGRRLILRGEKWHPPNSATPWPVHFKTDKSGRRVTNFPRVEIDVDNQRIPMLFDTGAETYLTQEALQRLDDGKAAFRATSMISKSVFDRWHQRHPEWPVIEDAQLGTHAAMIEVPDVSIAGIHVGKVWFTERPDKNFHEFMSSMMDSRVEGSIGGNALHSLNVTIDYRDSKAWVWKAQ
jgi:hypothetical protein